jgi:hypothetical protein
VVAEDLEDDMADTDGQQVRVTLGRFTVSYLDVEADWPSGGV